VEIIIRRSEEGSLNGEGVGLHHENKKKWNHDMKHHVIKK
jgi:hypothetical protein